METMVNTNTERIKRDKKGEENEEGRSREGRMSGRMDGGNEEDGRRREKEEREEGRG